MTTVAAVDCGTNSIRLLVAEVGADGGLVELHRDTRIVRLGQGVDATGRFDPAALDRTFAACDEYAQVLAEHRPAALRFIATSATRDAKNREEFFAGVRDRLGVTPEVITGDEEARLSFLGAATGVEAAARVPVQPPYLVMDLGGGSTELVLGGGGEGATSVESALSVEAALSMDIGSVRLTERFLHTHDHDGAPEPAAVAAARAEVDTWYDRARTTVDTSRARTLVGVAGTLTTLTAAVLDLPAYDRAQVHGAHLPIDALQHTVDAFLRMDRAARQALSYLHPGRVDVIPAGALILGRLVERLQTDVEAAGGTLTIVTSESDILDGTAMDLVSSVS
ncbi:Ppx/GppA phosphatase family protein [Brevibacterium litoralis]|uniref:Ppx/GppA phosphatase family protein n=1 Tax=Brevibacterium litoralis TaxID=3138935 RepID=UPI0032ED3BE1